MAAETIAIVLILFVLRALFVILQRPAYKTFKSIYSQNKKKVIKENGNWSWISDHGGPISVVTN